MTRFDQRPGIPRRQPLPSSPRRTYDQIRGAIRAGIITRDDQLVEDNLTSRYSTSRNSVREALQALALEGLVTRHRGSGTLVSGAITQLPMENVVPVDDKPDGTAVALSYELKELRFVPSNPTIAGHFGHENEVLLVEQVASLDGPLYVGSFYYAYPDVPRGEFAERVVRMHQSPGSLEDSMRFTYGVEVGRVQLTIEAVACDSRTARLLEIDEGSPLLLRERLVFDTDDNPITVSYVHFSASRVALKTVTYGEGTAEASLLT